MSKPILESEEERKQEIAFVMDMVNNLCIEAELTLVPYKTPNGKEIVAIRDARNGKMYAMLRNK